MKAMCFTGPRPNKLCGYKRERYAPFIEELTALLETYYQTGIRLFIVGGAQGFDQLAFWALIKLRNKHPDIKIHVYVPFKGQSDVWLYEDGCFGKREYRQMLALADEVRYIRKEKPERWDMNEAYHDRNKAMVNDTDLTFALQNDMDWKTTKGGTANCMQYAAGKKRMDWYTYQTEPYLKIGQCMIIESEE